MRIGELAKATCTSVEAIRFYEREGLLPCAGRSAGNHYRHYQRVHEERLGFIRQCRHLNMSLAEIRALLALRDTPSDDCGEVNTLLDEHIARVAQRLRELRLLEAELKALRARCASPHAVADCGILNELERIAAGACAPADVRPGGRKASDRVAARLEQKSSPRKT